jgi:hypothetical protein
MPSLDMEEDSLENTIFHLEEEIKKRVLVRDLWKTLKLQREELEYLKKKRNDEFEKEIFLENEIEAEFSVNKIIKGLDDRLVITIHIKVSGYLQYALDAQLDTGAMNSCAKHGAIPEYYWQPVNISFRAVNKTELKINI